MSSKGRIYEVSTERFNELKSEGKRLWIMSYIIIMSFQMTNQHKVNLLIADKLWTNAHKYKKHTYVDVAINDG